MILTHIDLATGTLQSPVVNAGLPEFSELTQPSAFLITTTVLFGIIFLRYVLMSGLYHQIVYRWFGGRRRHRLMHEVPGRDQVYKELGWSAISSLAFSIATVIMLILWERGYTAVYIDPRDYPIWYMPLSLALIMFIHETYYYWLHRWMHRPRIYRRIHKVHHDSVKTSSWTSFSFHPIESILQAIILPFLVFFIPVNVFVLLFLLMVMTVSAIINHAAVEVYPAGFRRHFARWVIGSAHHDLHHKQFNYNFGLYFTFWDRWMRTESPEFQQKFDVSTRAGERGPA